MKEELLTDCLYWLDKSFAIKVTNFLFKLRTVDNNYLKNEDTSKSINTLVKEYHYSNLSNGIKSIED